MIHRPISGTPMDSVLTEIFIKLERLETQVEMMSHALGELQQKIRLNESDHWQGVPTLPSVYAKAHGTSMSMEEFKKMFDGVDLKNPPIWSEPAAPTPIPEEKHAAHKSSFVLKI
jgi:hypothetical protein